MNADTEFNAHIVTAADTKIRCHAIWSTGSQYYSMHKEG